MAATLEEVERGRLDNPDEVESDESGVEDCDELLGEGEKIESETRLFCACDVTGSDEQSSNAEKLKVHKDKPFTRDALEEAKVSSHNGLFSWRINDAVFGACVGTIASPR